MSMSESSPPKNGFRIYRSTDDSLRMDALINGSAYALVMPDDLQDADEGYYDMDMKPWKGDADADADASAGETPARSGEKQG